MQAFQALRIHRDGERVRAGLERIQLDDLAAGEVVIKVAYSGINYKDALAATGAGSILRRFPLVGGIDLAGEVVSSEDAAITPGQRVLVTGCGLSETHDGGYAQYARVRSDWVIPLPQGLDLAQAMTLGTAGFAAALAIHRLQHQGLAPGGEVVVNGATGGVGSLAIDMLAGLGHRVLAITGKVARAQEYLRGLGASEVLDRHDLERGTRPLEAARFAGAIDNVGGEQLAWLARRMAPGASIACVGMAGGVELTGTVLPLILRGVSLLGINSAPTARALRERIWQRLASDLRPRHLDRINTRTVTLAQLPDVFNDYLHAGIVGRTLVRIGD